jgi:hypothetical protein
VVQAAGSILPLPILSGLHHHYVRIYFPTQTAFRPILIRMGAAVIQLGELMMILDSSVLHRQGSVTVDCAAHGVRSENRSQIH